MNTGIFKCLVLINLVAVGYSIESKREYTKTLDLDERLQLSVTMKPIMRYESHFKLPKRNKNHGVKLIKIVLPHGHKDEFDTNSRTMYKLLTKIDKKFKPLYIQNNNVDKIKLDDVLRSKAFRGSLEGDVTELRTPYTETNRINHTKDFSKFWQRLKALKYKNTLEKLKESNSKQYLRIVEVNLPPEFVHSVINFIAKYGTIRWNSTERLPSWSDLHFGRSRTIPMDAKHDLRVRSGEEHDPLAPGKLPFNVDQMDETTQLPSKWMPKYSFWNYWTYDKTLHQDECPGSLINVFGNCIGSPPH